MAPVSSLWPSPFFQKELQVPCILSITLRSSIGWRLTRIAWHWPHLAGHSRYSGHLGKPYAYRRSDSLLERIGAGFSCSRLSRGWKLVATMKSAFPEAASRHQIADIVMRVSRAVVQKRSSTRSQGICSFVLWIAGPAFFEISRIPSCLECFFGRISCYRLVLEVHFILGKKKHIANLRG